MKTLKQYTVEEKNKAGQWAQYHKDSREWRRHYIANGTEYKGEFLGHTKRQAAENWREVANG